MKDSVKDSVWSPLRSPLYRAFWICAFISNTGTWIQDVAAGWVITHLSASPLVVSLLSFSSSLPVVFLSIPAGYIADLGYRRRVLIVAQIIMCFFAGLIAWSFYNGTLTEYSLLGFSLMMGIGFALTNPAFQSVLTDLTPDDDQVKAVLVYYMGINITRVVGPALGGSLLGAAGPTAAFALNTVSFLGLILFFYVWPLPKTSNPVSKIVVTEGDWQPLLKLQNFRLWIEIFLVTYFASALWALYPTKARLVLDLSSYQYGSLLAFLGLGACTSALLSSRVMDPAKTKKSLAGSYFVFALAILILAWATEYWHLCVAMYFAGTGWLVLSTLMNMSSRQITGTSQLRSTMLGVFLSVFYTGMALGAISWGALADLGSAKTALIIASLGLCAVSLGKIKAA